MDLRPGEVLSHYRLVEKIGEGGMGVVYRAEDTKLRRQVALKILPPELVANEERRLRFVREARTAAAVNHPNIATIHEINEADGVVFITMELVEGKTLRKQLGGKPLPMKDTLRIATEMAKGLARAHQAHVIHRDLKPDNIMVGPDGHIKILDFGLAKLHEDLDEVRRSELSKLDTVSGEMTREGKVMGTPAYMSPEQARGKPVDARSDLFAFGITLYEMATGRVPFRGKTATDTLSAIIRDTPLPTCEINPEVPPEMDRIIGKCLEKEPGERYQHTDELIVDLRHLKRTTDSGAQRIQTPTMPVPIPGNRRWRRRIPLAAITVLLIAGGLAAWQILRTEKGLHTGDKIIVADFENRSGRPELGAAIRDAVENMLAQSGFVDVVRGVRLGEILARQNRAGISRIDRDTADDLCRADDCDGFLLGLIEPHGRGYSVTVELYRAGRSEAIVVRSTPNSPEDELLMALHDMVIEVRHAIGEAPDMLSELCPPTTRSLSAYQALAKAWRAGSIDDIERLAREALKIDPEFTIAHLFIGGSLWNQGHYSKSRQELEEAYSRRSRLPKRCQLQVESAYLSSIYDYDASFEMAKIYTELYTSDFWGPHILSLQYSLAYEELRDYVSYCRDAWRLSPASKFLQDNLSYGLQCLGDADGIDRLVSELQRMKIPDKWIDYNRLNGSMLRNEEREIRQIVESMRRASPGERVTANNELLKWLLASGRLAEAKNEAAVARHAADELRDIRSLQWIELTEAWFARRRDGATPILSDSVQKVLRGYLPSLRQFASFSVDIEQDEPLAQLLGGYDLAAAAPRSRFVRETLQFVRGCVALTRTDFQTAREQLEPVAHKSILASPHRMLGRAYEGLGRLGEAAGEYEDALKNPYLRWEIDGSFPVAAIQVLEEFRLAQIYETIGDTDRARHWYERFTEDWKDADPDIPELIEARKRLVELTAAGPSTGNGGQ